VYSSPSYRKDLYCILQFAQSPWLHDYIELNTKFRTFKNDFEKNIYKLINNAVFGKTMENVRVRVDVKLLTQWEGRYGAEAMVAKPNLIELRKLEVKFNKPTYVVICILEVFVRIQEVFVRISPRVHGTAKNAKLCIPIVIASYTIQNVTMIMKRDISKFDTSDYSSDNAYGIPQIKKFLAL